MKFTTTVIAVALIGATTALSGAIPSQMEGLKEDCDKSHKKNPPNFTFPPTGETPPTGQTPPTNTTPPTTTLTPPPTTTTTPPTTTLTPPPTTTEAACTSSVVAQLIGVDLLNCAKINILSAKRDIYPRTNIDDPVLEEMKRRQGFAPRGICDSSAAAKLIAGNILSCADVNVLSASDEQLDADTCSSQEVGLLAALGVLNCANVNILSTRGHQNKRAHLEAKRETGYHALVERVLNVRDCAAQTGAKLISGNALNCAVVNVLSSKGPENEQCATETTADLIALSALNCADINVLSS